MEPPSRDSSTCTTCRHVLALTRRVTRPTRTIPCSYLSRLMQTYGRHPLSVRDGTPPAHTRRQSRNAGALSSTTRSGAGHWASRRRRRPLLRVCGEGGEGSGTRRAVRPER